MYKDYYKPIAWGETLPLNNPHAFSVSMPTVESVLEYARDTEVSHSYIKSAYPRIAFHPYVKEVLKKAAEELSLGSCSLFLLPNRSSAERVASLSGTKPEYREYHGYTLSLFNEHLTDDIKNYYTFMKHCGYMVFSREAEDLLKRLGIETPEFQEKVLEHDAEKVIHEVLSEGYDCENILLSTCGMNAIYAGFEGVRRRAEKEGRKLFILLGCAYSDTIHILNKCCEELIFIHNPQDMKKLEEVISERGDDIAALYMETVVNPLISVPDFPAIYKLAQEHNFPVLVDNTFATPWNVNITPYCDLIFESLTKFASGMGDVMAGTVILPDTSRFTKTFFDEISEWVVPLYSRVAKRLAYTIRGYRERVEIINRNTAALAEALKNHPRIEEIYTVYSCRKNFEKIARHDNAWGGVLSLVFKGELKESYDTLDLPKGPSLGTEFPLVMPYVLLAHYNDTTTEEGKSYLASLGLSEKLLRFSIGVDDPSAILDAINRM